MEENQEPIHYRRIKSYVLREGRLTTGQERALRELWPTYGIEYEEKELDLISIFGREAALTVEIGFGMGKSLVEMAKNAPERNFIGIELDEKYFKIAEGRILNVEWRIQRSSY